MSRRIFALSTVMLICASSQFASANESGAITGGVGGAVAGAVVGGPVGAVVGGVGGAAIGNSMTNHRHYHRGYAYHPYHHQYVQYLLIDEAKSEGVVGVRDSGQMAHLGFHAIGLSRGRCKNSAAYGRCAQIPTRAVRNGRVGHRGC